MTKQTDRSMANAVMLKIFRNGGGDNQEWTKDRDSIQYALSQARHEGFNEGRLSMIDEKIKCLRDGICALDAVEKTLKTKPTGGGNE